MRWKRKLKLSAHPEGGYFRETYRSREKVPGGKGRSCATVIYYLLEKGQFSAFHRLKSDEIWYFHAGGPLKLFLLEGPSKARVIELGTGRFQAVIPKGTWFAACPAPRSRYSLVSCSVSPGFDFSDFELARRDTFIKKFPRHRKLIGRFTHDR